jgi:ABC-type glucose/galactose transport system permease subunit
VVSIRHVASPFPANIITTLYGCSLASKLWGTFFVAIHDSPLQPTYYVIDTSFNISAKLLPGTAGRMVDVPLLPHLRFTDIGRNIYAIGGNVTAARLAGVRVDRYRVAIFAVTGLVAGVAGIVLAARISSGQPGSGTQDLALSSIAAVLLGGTALTGGKGTILGTILGVLVLGVLSNGLLLMNVSAYWQLIAQGTVLVTVVVLQVKPWSKASRESRR